MNPFEGMSEEQKEYEAVRLANLIDKLHTMGVVKPAKLGEDGKPQVVYNTINSQLSNAIYDECQTQLVVKVLFETSFLHKFTYLASIDHRLQSCVFKIHYLNTF